MIARVLTGILSALPLIAAILAWIGYRHDSQRLKLLALPLALIGLVGWANLAMMYLLSHS